MFVYVGAELVSSQCSSCWWHLKCVHNTYCADCVSAAGDVENSHVCLLHFHRGWDSAGISWWKENNASLYGLVKYEHCLLWGGTLLSLNNMSRGYWHWGLYYCHKDYNKHHFTTLVFSWPWNVLGSTCWHFDAEHSGRRRGRRRNGSFMQISQHKVSCCYFGESDVFDVVLRIDIRGAGLVCRQEQRVETK